MPADAARRPAHSTRRRGRRRRRRRRAAAAAPTPPDPPPAGGQPLPAHLRRPVGRSRIDFTSSMANLEESSTKLRFRTCNESIHVELVLLLKTVPDLFFGVVTPMVIEK